MRPRPSSSTTVRRSRSLCRGERGFESVPRLAWRGTRGSVTSDRRRERIDLELEASGARDVVVPDVGDGRRVARRSRPLRGPRTRHPVRVSSRRPGAVTGAGALAHERATRERAWPFRHHTSTIGHVVENSRPALSVVIPAHNEAGGIGSTVDGIVRALDDASVDYEIVVVDDASVDTTAETVVGR